MIIFRKRGLRDTTPDKIELANGLTLRKIKCSDFKKKNAGWLYRENGFLYKFYVNSTDYEVYIGNGRKSVGNVSFSWSKDRPDDLHLALIEIEDDYQGRGYATEILRYFIDFAKNTLGAKKIYLEASKMGYPVYLKLGFVDVSDNYKKSFIRKLWNMYLNAVLDDTNFVDLKEMELDLC